MSVFYPFYYIMLAIFLILFYMVERFKLGKASFLKRAEDIYHHELLQPMTKAIQFIWFYKTLMCVTVFASVEGD